MPLILSGTTSFDLTSDELVFTDTTDYAAYSINAATVAGCLTLTGPSGVFHNNTDFQNPDIQPSVSTSYSNLLPTVGGEPIQGGYTVKYAVQFSFTGEATAINQLTVSGINVVNLFPPGTSFQIVGGPDAGTYTVLSSSWTGSDTLVTLTASTLTVSQEENIVLQSTTTFTYTYCFEAPTVSIEASIDCDCSRIVSRDITNYNITACNTTIQPSSVSRIHTVNAPNGPSGTPVVAPTVSSLPTVTVSPIWTKTWNTTIQTTLSYTLPSGLSVTYVARGYDEYKVSCDEGLCCVFQCMQNLRNRYEMALYKNPSQAQELFPKMFAMTTAWMMYSVAQQCGSPSDKAKYLSQIIAIVKSADCDCCNDEANDTYPTEITPLCGAVAGGSGNTYVVSTCGNGITVTSNTVGTTTTYEVCIDTDILDAAIAKYIQDHPQTLGDLSDVTITAVQANQTLLWNGTQWVNGNVPLDSLSDVNAPAPNSGQVLTWNGSAWVASTPAVSFSKAYLLNAFTTPESRTSSGVFTSMAQTMPLATGNNPLGSNGDTVEFSMVFSHSGANIDSLVALALNGTPVAALLIPTAGSTQTVEIGGVITRVSPTSLYVVLNRTGYVDTVAASLNAVSNYQGASTVADITSTQLQIAPYALISTDTVSCIYANYKSVKK